MRRLFIHVFCLVLLGLLLVLLRLPALQAIGEWLAFDSRCTEPPRLAALLMGGINTRPKGAASWLKQHTEAALVFARSADEELTLIGLEPNEAVLTQKLLGLYGIPASRTVILPEPQVRNTYEEMTRLIAYVKSREPRETTLFLLTNWTHARRAAWTAEHLAEGSGIKICTVPLRQAGESVNNWWESDRGTLEVFAEYLKSLRYGVKYGLFHPT